MAAAAAVFSRFLDRRFDAARRSRGKAFFRLVESKLAGGGYRGREEKYRIRAFEYRQAAV